MTKRTIGNHARLKNGSDGKMQNEHELEAGDPGEIVGTPQAGETAGTGTTSGNDGGDLEGPHNEHELEGDELEAGESDETDDEHELEAGESDETAGGELSRARQQAGRYRRQLRELEGERDELVAALWRERVASLGMLADPDDLELDLEALHDPGRLRELAGELVAARPHLRSRRIRERAGQGEGTTTDAVSLAAILQSRA